MALEIVATFKYLTSYVDTWAVSRVFYDNFTLKSDENLFQNKFILFEIKFVKSK